VSLAACSSAITVRGTMQRGAELRFSADGSACYLLARVEQQGGLPYLGMQRFGGEPCSVRAAQAKARLLTKGTAVVMYATGMQMGRCSHEPVETVLRLVGEVDIRPVALPARQEPAAAAAEGSAE
jgi:hypothetical protein